MKTILVKEYLGFKIEVLSLDVDFHEVKVYSNFLELQPFYKSFSRDLEIALKKGRDTVIFQKYK